MILLHRCKFPYLLRRNTSDVIRAFASMDSRSASIQQPEELRIIPDVDAVFKRKRILRSKVRKILKAMDPEIRAQQDKEIRDVVVGAPWFKSCTGLCAYISCSALREVDTSAILAEILQNGAAVQDSHGHTRKKLYVPRIEDKNSHMRMLHITGVDDLVANSMDILEPALVDAKGSQCEDGAFSSVKSHARYTLHYLDCKDINISFC
uniref:5-formyltetrahydrofolate cyclo-ligase n=1 Tax=Kalanchoe fedtschenkoi TaxID=63787 RepID=A0A7N0VGC4_KALFE